MRSIYDAVAYLRFRLLHLEIGPDRGLEDYVKADLKGRLVKRISKGCLGREVEF